MTGDASRPFSAWAGPRSPRLLIVGEAWGEAEAATRQPFVGYSGQELWRMLGEALPECAPEAHIRASSLFRYANAWVGQRGEWLEAASIAFTNVFNLRPMANKMDSLCATKKSLPSDYSLPPLSRALYLLPQYLPHVVRLYEEISAARPNLVLAAGNTACWALLQATNIGSIRGAVATYRPAASQSGESDGLGATTHTSRRLTGRLKILPTYHPAGVLRQWSWRTIVIADLMKAFREAQFPELRRPERTVIISPTLPEIYDWVDQTLSTRPEALSVDIETGQQQIKCIGFARSRSEALVIPFVDLGHHSGSYWPTPRDESFAWNYVRTLLESSIPKLFQNGLYDLQYIYRMGLRPQACLHDTMLLHHSHFPELRKGLGFLGSIYTNEASWKLMRRPKADTEKRDE